MKAYTTRVGEGALPTEDADDRRTCCTRWAANSARRPAGRGAAAGSMPSRLVTPTMINGIDELAITNLDGLDNVDPIKVCVAYRLNGKTTRRSAVRCRATGAMRADLSRDSRAGSNRRRKRKNFPICLTKHGNYVQTHRGADWRALDDDQRRPGPRPDHHPLDCHGPRAANRFRVTSPSSWTATAAGRKSAACPNQGPRKRRRSGARMRGRLRRTADRVSHALRLFGRKLAATENRSLRADAIAREVS